jgi:hypothetical protein
MKYETIHAQIRELINRLVSCSLSVSQYYPTLKSANGIQEITLRNGTNNSIAMKNIVYDEIYDYLEREGNYHIKLIDGSLISFSYQFNEGSGHLIKHRLVFFPSPTLPSLDDYPELYGEDNLFIDIVKNNIVRFPIRFDYDPVHAKNIVHPESHVTFGQYQNCRIPVSMPVSPRKFILFILRNFYFTAYTNYMNLFEKKMISVIPHHTITTCEKKIGHFVL